MSQFLSLDDMALGGAATGFTITNLDIELAGLNNAFDHGQPARSRKRSGRTGSSTAMPEPSSLMLSAIGLFAVAFGAKKRVLA